jgi:hypothetical protein
MTEIKKWFEVGVEFLKVHESGQEKLVVEKYLFDAVSFTDAETRVNEIMANIINGSFFVNQIKIAGFSEVIPYDTGEFWFRVLVDYIYDNNKSGEKRSRANYLIFADNIEEALERIKLWLNDSVAFFEIVSLTKSKICDIFPYFEIEQEEEENEH